MDNTNIKSGERLRIVIGNDFQNIGNMWYWSFPWRTEENKESILHTEFYDSALNVAGDLSA
jgi:hypothetical protein